MGDSLLKGTEGPICKPDPLQKEDCCLSGACIRDVKRKLPALIQPLDLLLIFQVVDEEDSRQGLRAIKRDFRAFGQVVKG